jgi:NRPS condensation-like uncharacterized protein
MREVRKEYGVTVNDVALAAITGSGLDAAPG